jgi:hypothetical protein
MYSAEAFIAATRELLALEVHPVRYYTSIEDYLDQALAWQREVMRDLFDPDPF